ncbi:uncharacterized protein LOC127804197 [Diospyros lotus]|uniref:uncharacterized protein LOC127804197 n=1 Tax=Diospyros lotus TaxID=55363 RepID=UPI0022528B8C|nr:uncharacterized protein LOC127804197 [Diospyros lotus]
MASPALAQQPRNRKECNNRRDFIKYLREETEKAKIIVFHGGSKAAEQGGTLRILDTLMGQNPTANFLYLDVAAVKSVANQLGITDDNVPTVILYRYGGDAPVWISPNDSAQLDSRVRNFLGNSR